MTGQETPRQSPWIVTVTPTLMSGTVVPPSRSVPDITETITAPCCEGPGDAVAAYMKDERGELDGA